MRTYIYAVFILSVFVTGQALAQSQHTKAAGCSALNAAFPQPDPLAEYQAIELALSAPALHQIGEGRLDAAQAIADQAGLWANPTLSMDRDRVGSGVTRSTETVIALSQSIDLFGRRALRREAALRRVAATRLEQHERLRVLTAEVRRSYAEVLHSQQRREALMRWNERLRLALDKTTHLVKGGEASGYDRRRLERELQSARMRLQIAEADGLRAKETLAGWLERPAKELCLSDELITAQAPPLENLLQTVESRADFAALRAHAQSYDSERRAAERAWLPEVTVGVGQKRVEENSHSESGLALLISLPLPLFDQGKAQQAQARGNAEALRAERAMKLAQAQAQLRGAWQQAQALREAAQTFQQEAVPSSRDLSLIAETAYQGGEASLLELLDAYRTELEAETNALDLALRARLARIELDTLSGIEMK